MIGILDYGAGNLKSVKKAIDHIGVESRIIKSPEQMEAISRLILPGVGAFGASMQKMSQRHLDQIVKNWVREERPFLGICVGMQLLFETSEESPETGGLGVFEGSVPRFNHPRVPQIGWNRLWQKQMSPLLKDIDDGAFFYFLHSYYCLPDEEKLACATADYGLTYCAAISVGNVHAVQFHPEKSADNGLKLLSNWIDHC